MGKLNKYLSVLFIALSALILTEASASDITKEIDATNFDEVTLDTPAKLHITIGRDFSVTAKGDEGRIENTEFNRSGDRLEITSKRRFRFFGRNNDGHLDVYITMPDIREMVIDGSGDAFITGVNGEDLELKIDGSGDIEVEGTSEKLEINIDGSGDVDLEGFSGKEVNVNIDGSGDVDIAGTCDRLEIEIDASGDVKARKLICKEVNVIIEGSGDSYVHATDTFSYDSDGSGNVDVFGKPKEVIDNSRDSNTKIRVR